MPLTPTEAKEADRLEELAARRELTQHELDRYNRLAAMSLMRAKADPKARNW